MNEAIKTWKIEPSVGIGPVRLGMSRAEARAAMQADGWQWDAKASRFNAQRIDYFDTSCPLKYELADDDSVMFIEVSSFDVPVRIEYLDQNIFELGARALFNRMAKAEGGAHVYAASGYTFEKQILTLWDADRQYDHRGGQRRVVWSAVGLGNQAYLDAVSALKDNAPDWLDEVFDEFGNLLDDDDE